MSGSVLDRPAIDGPPLDGPPHDGPAVREANGPIVQSIAIGFRALYAGSIVLALLWLVTNIRQVPADSQAVVWRFGRVVDVRPAGLVVAWPRPIERLSVVPSADRQIALPLPRVPLPAGLEDSYTRALPADASAKAGAFLTGDGGVVLLDATLLYQVSDARDYVLAEEHVPPALRRVFLASATGIAAGHGLDAFLVSQSGAGVTGMEAARLALRAELPAAMNQRLAELSRAGAGLGVTVARVDLQASLPPQAKLAYDSVLEAGQRADQSVAAARTDATRAAQEGAQEHDRLIAEAHAAAAERVGGARTRTASIAAVEARMTTSARPGLLDQLFRERMAAIMPRVGRVTAVDPQGGARVILPGSRP